ncbi:MAG: hypothetical protein KC621_18685, partial [Myxococcales bacterium]|nr:hypothetical protein [Myxococcales bacterium]
MFPVGVGVLCGVAAAAVPFPAAEQWVPLARSQLPFEDPAGDQLVAPPDAGLDLVGDATTPALWWYADADTFFLRARVAAEPTTNALWAFP